MPSFPRIDGFSQRVWDDPDCLNAELVYAISDGQAIKIGKSNGHPMTRLKDLQVGNPRTLTLLAYTATLTERQAHRRLHKYHQRGEWFSLCPEVLAELKNWDWLDQDALKELT